MTDPNPSDRTKARAAAEATDRRRSAAEKSAAQSERVIEEHAKLGPLEPLDTKAEASTGVGPPPTPNETRRLRQRPPATGGGLGGSTNATAASKSLSIYLNDHLAGSTIGVGLVRRTHARHRNTPLGDYLERLTSEIESDREALEKLTAELGIRRNRLKALAAWAAEKAGRLKLNGQLTGYSPLSRLVELESLYLGITGKREMWRALQHALADRAPGFDFEALGRRAERQASEVEEHRLAAARIVLSPSVD
jgi:hypothetical protein